MHLAEPTLGLLQIMQSLKDKTIIKGFAGLPIIILIAIVLGVFFLVGSYFRENKHANEQNSKQSSPAYGTKEPFYSKDGLYLNHSWPSEGSFSAEETEILLFNESNSSVEVKSFDLIYAVEGKAYPHKSGTWEKFPSKTSWEKIEYLNISPQYYKGEKLLLTPNQKGKLHWHIQFGSQPLDGKQTVTVKLTLLKDGQTINIDEQFTKASGTVFSKEDH